MKILLAFSVALVLYACDAPSCPPDEASSAVSSSSTGSPPPEPTSDAGSKLCDDENECTDDWIESGVCNSRVVDDPIPCGDGGRCRLGACCPSWRCWDSVAMFCVDACLSGQACGADGVCAVNATCFDGTKNGTETDVDCGGWVGNGCAGCEIGKTCLVETDCASWYCKSGTCVTTCENGVKDSGESGADCGGQTLCKRCPAEWECQMGSDCESGSCFPNGLCAP